MGGANSAISSARRLRPQPEQKQKASCTHDSKSCYRTGGGVLSGSGGGDPGGADELEDRSL